MPVLSNLHLTFADPFSLLGSALALGAIAYLLLAIRQVWRFREHRRPGSAFRPPVTVMAPVYGAPPGLYDCLRSLFLQDYPVFQLVFGLHSADDPGAAVIARLRAEFPDVDTTVVIDSTRIGSNPKVCNLANMYRGVKHNVIAVVDSDVKVDNRFVDVVVEPFQDPRVGGVTCLYKAEAVGGPASQLGALYINDWFLPSALVDVSLREMDFVYGAATVVTRESLAATGGFEARAYAVAEDDVLGELLSRAGYEIRLAPYVVTTMVTEATIRTLTHHELRWMRSLRACRPIEHALSVVMHAFAPVVILLLLRPSTFGFTLLGAMLVLRVALHYLLRSRTPIAAPPAPWLLPARECLNFMLWAASFASRRMSWGTYSLEAVGGRRMAMRKSETQ